MNRKSIDIYSYIQTILWSVLAGCIFTGAMIYYAQNDVINNASSRYNERVLREYIKNTVILQNEDLEAERPNDYRIDIHLGYLHKVIKEYDKAEEYYKKAVQKAPINVYKPLYELASFYIERGRFDEAKAIMDDLPQKSNDSLIKFQSYLHRKLGDAYYEKGLYYYAMEEYEDALYYWKKRYTPKQAYIREVNEKLFQSAINIADICVNNNRINEAVKFLNKAEKVHPRDFNVQYKLALTTASIDPERSYKYFKKLFKQNPVKVDYTAYYKLLDNLAAFYEEEGEYTKAKLYTFRAKNLLEFVSENLIYPRDIDFKVTGVSLYNLNRKNKILIKFNLRNTSNIPIKRLNMDVIYKLDGHEIETLSQTLVDATSSLMVGDAISESTIVPKLFKKYKSAEIPKLSAEIYLYKSKDRKICVYNGKLFEQKSKVEIKQSKHSLDCQSYIKFFSNQILNFEQSFKSYKDSR